MVVQLYSLSLRSLGCGLGTWCVELKDRRAFLSPACVVPSYLATHLRRRGSSTGLPLHAANFFLLFPVLLKEFLSTIMKREDDLT